MSSALATLSFRSSREAARTTSAPVAGSFLPAAFSTSAADLLEARTILVRCPLDQGPEHAERWPIRVLECGLGGIAFAVGPVQDAIPGGFELEDLGVVEGAAAEELDQAVFMTVDVGLLEDVGIVGA